jgi:uncharacterized protein (TIGR02145 family)
VPATTYTIPEGKRLVAFTDASKAQGVIKCTVPAITRQPTSKTACSGTPTRLDVSVNPLPAYQWYKNTEAVSEGSGGATANYTTGVLTAGATYSVTASIGACSVTSTTVTVSVTDCSAITCTPQESIKNFSDFNPCSNAAIGTIWYLTDTRQPGGNNQTYKVRKMENSAIWLVQDLKFGNCASNTWMEDNSYQNTITATNVAAGYVGHCTTVSASTLSGSSIQFRYSWLAAMQNPNMNEWDPTVQHGCYGALTDVVTDHHPTKCQGLCPAGWHIPTAVEQQAMYSAVSTVTAKTCFEALHTASVWEGVSMQQGNYLVMAYQTSTSYINALNVMRVRCMDMRIGGLTACGASDGNWYIYSDYPVRCVRN